MRSHFRKKIFFQDLNLSDGLKMVPKDALGPSDQFPRGPRPVGGHSFEKKEFFEDFNLSVWLQMVPRDALGPSDQFPRGPRPL